MSPSHSITKQARRDIETSCLTPLWEAEISRASKVQSAAKRDSLLPIPLRREGNLHSALYLYVCLTAQPLQQLSPCLCRSHICAHPSAAVARIGASPGSTSSRKVSGLTRICERPAGALCQPFHARPTNSRVFPPRTTTAPYLAGHNVVELLAPRLVRCHRWHAGAAQECVVLALVHWHVR